MRAVPRPDRLYLALRAIVRPARRKASHRPKITPMDVADLQPACASLEFAAAFTANSSTKPVRDREAWSRAVGRFRLSHEVIRGLPVFAV